MFDKASKVKDIFSAVAGKYDCMNDLMSFGLHRAWKKHLCNLLVNKNAKLLDCAAGSGDVALSFYKDAKKLYGEPKVTISDINEDMLAKAKEKCGKDNIFDIDFVCADAQNLPFEDNSFDYYTISFGIRNVSDRSRALSESFRVLKPGASFFCLEFSPITTPIVKDLYCAYSNFIIPNIGSLITARKDAYEYLTDSINQFPCPQEFVKEVKNQGFVDVDYKEFLTGIAVLYRGMKPC